jgi:Tfp pilus assembly protein PilE
MTAPITSEENQPMLRAKTRHSAAGQRGITLIGLLFWGIVVAVVALVVIRVLPTINEYTTIQRAVTKIAQENPATVAEARKAFERQQNIEYSISSIGPQDLKVTKENDKVVIRFAYDKEVPLFEPVYLLIKYSGEGRSN